MNRYVFKFVISQVIVQGIYIASSLNNRNINSVLHGNPKQYIYWRVNDAEFEFF